jgi:hypothetical protein
MADRDRRIPCGVEPGPGRSRKGVRWQGNPTLAKTYRKQKLFVEIKE